MIVPLVAVHRLDVGEHVVAGYFPQVGVAVRPLQQCRADPVEIEPDRALLPRQAARAAIAQNPGPAPGLRTDAGRESFQTLGKPGLEGGLTVVQEDPHLSTDRDGMSDREVAGPERGEDLAVSDDVALDVPGQDYG